MWVIFLLSGMSVALCVLGIIFIANKVIIAIKKEQEEFNNKKES